MRFKLGVLLFFTLSILAFGIYMLAYAQDDVRVEIKVDEGETPRGEGVMIIKDVQSSDDGESPRPKVFIMSEDGKNMTKVDEGEIDKGGGNKRFEKKANQEERQRMRQESREGMKEEAMQKNASPDSDSAKKMRENSPNIVKEQAKNAAAQKEQAKTQVPASDEDKLRQYLSAISEKNLFLPLGTVKREEKASYAVTAIISNTSEESKPKAIIEQTGTNNSYYVSEGDNLVGEEKVTDIEESMVKVNRSGEEMTLQLGVGTQGGGGRKGGGGGQRRGGAPGGASDGGKTASSIEKPQSGGSPNLDNLPPMVRKMLEERGISIEDLKNNPDLQEKLKAEFQQRFGGRGQRSGGPEVQQIRPR